ncbi:unnamed protein product [Soboliphyme baturini]|uniref:PDZ domain-containing protein n=1 Tax=Soboliphyme baturini TaxID=241478 RepID=A0A183IAG2_9BILA|nr:unnamed protein product [Soboliphyme baturini]
MTSKLATGHHALTYKFQLPHHLTKTIRIRKRNLKLGVTVEATNQACNGCLITHISTVGALGRDGRVQVGDFLLRINNENMRYVSNAQAKAILKRTNLVSTDFK